MFVGHNFTPVQLPVTRGLRSQVMAPSAKEIIQAITFVTCQLYRRRQVKEEE